MNIDQAIQLIEAIAKLVGVLIWPALIAFALIRFSPALKEFFGSLGEFTFKGAGFEATAKRKQAEAAAALVAASVARPDAKTTPESAAQTRKRPPVLLPRQLPLILLEGQVMYQFFGLMITQIIIYSSVSH